MPITTEIDTETGVVVHRTSGRISGSDIEAAFVKGITHPDFRAGMGRVWDVRSGAGDELTSGEIGRFAKVVKERMEARGRGRVGVVVAQDLSFGIARIFLSWLDNEDLPFEREIFRDFYEAVRWASGSPPENGEGA